MKLIDFPDKPVVGLYANTKLEKQDVLDLDLVVNQKLSQFDSLGVYVEMEAFAGITFEAFVEDLKKFLPKMSHFKKKAVVSPDSFMVKVGEGLSKLIPGVEVRHFLPEQKKEAKEWVADGMG